MNFYHQTQPQYRQKINPYFPTQFYQQKAPTFLIDRKVWLALRKVLLILCVLITGTHLWLSSIFLNLEQSIRVLENTRHELIECHIDLSAKRDNLYSAEHILTIASERLSLNSPDKEQVQIL